ELGRSLGRSLMRLLNPDFPGAPDPDGAARVFVFAHETLLAEARLRIKAKDDDLATYEDLLDEWADEYAQQDWPIDTPRYLLRPYPRELARRARDPAAPGASRRKPMNRALDRLISFATNAARQDRMLVYTYGDAAALAEIATVRRLILARPVPDLA